MGLSYSISNSDLFGQLFQAWKRWNTQLRANFVQCSCRSVVQDNVSPNYVSQSPLQRGITLFGVLGEILKKGPIIQTRTPHQMPSKCRPEGITAKIIAELLEGSCIAFRVQGIPAGGRQQVYFWVTCRSCQICELRAQCHALTRRTFDLPKVQFL